MYYTFLCVFNWQRAWQQKRKKEKTADQLSEELKKELQDKPLLKKLFKASFDQRRSQLSAVEDGDVRKIRDLCPLLLDAEFVSFYYSHCFGY